MSALGKRVRSSVGLAKRNNEDGTAISESKRRKNEESEWVLPYVSFPDITNHPPSRHMKIPGYDVLKILHAASYTLRIDRNNLDGTTHLATICQGLMGQVSSLLEDNDEPLHHAFSGWIPSLADIGGRQGLIAFQVLWVALIKIDEHSIPVYLLNACKASICAAAILIHAVLAQHALIVEIGEEDLDGTYDPLLDNSGSARDDAPDPIAVDIDEEETLTAANNMTATSMLNPSLREVVNLDDEEPKSRLPSKKQNPVWLFYKDIPKALAHNDVQHGHKNGTTYFGCNFCCWTSCITKSSNGKLTHLEDHLINPPTHF
ncbi:hypothetical protein BT69DRAFT_1331720 [Atractiella rhizophila]|nr:hypothetical protein BT69DRAFT_1331720 [Atractiella rhizophila]